MNLRLEKGGFGPKVVPDVYKVKLIVDNQEFVRELKVLKDPVSEGSIEDIKAQVEVSLELRDAMNLAVNMINTIEVVRSELDSILPKLTKKSDIENLTNEIKDEELKKAKNELHLAELSQKLEENSKKSGDVKTEREMKSLQLEEEISKEQCDFANDEIMAGAPKANATV